MSPQASEDTEAPHPRTTGVLFGHASAEAALLAAYRSGRIPHAFLIAGPKGIGKATLAYRLARFVLAHPDPASPAVAKAASLAVDPGIAQWAFDKGHPAGVGTDTLPGSEVLYIPLRAPVQARGVLALRAKSRRLLKIPEQRQLLDTFAALIAIALERGDIDEMSVGMKVGRDKWGVSGGMETRDIYALEDLLDVSGVTYACSPTTSIENQSAKDGTTTSTRSRSASS